MTNGEAREHPSSSSGGGGSDAAATKDVSEVVEYLQLAGQRYREHVELLRQEQAVREAQRAPFKPTITAFAEAASKTSVVRHGTSIGARLHELHQRKMAMLEEEAALSAQRREAEERSACTFAPAVTRRASRVARSGGDGDGDSSGSEGDDVGAALLRWGQQRRARQVRRQIDAAKDELRTVTATPRISAYAAEKARAERRGGAVPIEVSLMAEAERRRARKQAAYEQTYATGKGTTSSSLQQEQQRRRFVPEISAHAASIQFERGVVDRLYTHHQQKQQRRHNAGGASRSSSVRSAIVFDEEGALHCTFQPQLSPQSHELSRRYYEAEGDGAEDPHERLYRNAHHTPKYRKPAAAAEPSGRPEISEASRRIVEERRRQLALAGDPAALDGSPGSRLYPGTAAAASPSPRPTFKKKVVTARDVELQAALTFAPAVSAASEKLWRQRVAALQSSGAARSAEEARQLLWRKAEKRREEELARQRDQRRRQDAADCTFHPKAGRPPQRRSGYMAMPVETRTTLWARQREARVAGLRAEVEGSALAECSFHPHVDPVFPLPRADAPLATGVEGYVERQAEARRRREEAAEWWRPQYARGQPLASSARQQRGTHDSRSPLRRTATSTVSTEANEQEEVFVQHWARPPPSTSLTASSFSHTSQPDVPSAESSPARQRQAYVVRQPPPAAADVPGPYAWRSSAGDSRQDEEGVPAWRKPLRYRATSAK